MNSLCRIGIREVSVNSWFSIYLDIEINTEINACGVCVYVCVYVCMCYAGERGIRWGD